MKTLSEFDIALAQRLNIITPSFSYSCLTRVRQLLG